MSFGTVTGSLSHPRGTKSSVDDSYLFVPFNPNSNNDYRPNIANMYAGLICMETVAGATIWVNVYTPTTQFNIAPVDGDVSPDNQRYYYLVKESLTYLYGGIIVVKIIDGSVVRFVRFADKDTTPYALTASKMDRIIVNSKVNVGTSMYFYDTTITSDNIVVMHWDSYFGENICP